MKMNLSIILAVIILVIEQSNYATPLIDAVKNNNLAEVQKLIKNGADINEQDPYGGTALHFAADIGAVDIVETLIKNKADVNAKNQNYGMTPLMVASSADRAHIMTKKAEQEKLLNDEAKIVKLLLDHGALVNEKANLWGETALIYSMGSTPKIAMTLLQHGADVNAKNNSGVTSLYNAAVAGRPEMVELLIKHGADVNAKNIYGDTAIFGASFVPTMPKQSQAEKAKRFDDAIKIVKLLIDKGASANDKNDSGVTPLMDAAVSGAIPVAKVLIDKGADLYAKDTFGEMAIDAAKRRKKSEMVKFLEEKMAAAK